jgi:hypothetical protein
MQQPDPKPYSQEEIADLQSDLDTNRRHHEAVCAFSDGCQGCEYTLERDRYHLTIADRDRKLVRAVKALDRASRHFQSTECICFSVERNHGHAFNCPEGARLEALAALEAITPTTNGELSTPLLRVHFQQYHW